MFTFRAITWRILLLVAPLGLVLPTLAQPKFQNNDLQSRGDRVNDEKLIYDAVFHYRIEQWGDKIDGSIFLSIQGKDPDESFMKRFAMLKHSVKEGSKAEYKKKNKSFVSLVDHSTGQQAVLLSAES